MVWYIYRVLDEWFVKHLPHALPDALLVCVVWAETALEALKTALRDA